MKTGYYEKYTGSEIHVTVPETAEGQPITVIGAKAFLNCREITALKLPESVDTVEDWAFAHMKRLERLYLPAKQIHFGRKVFLGCEHLAEIIPGDSVCIYEGIPFFLASSVLMAETEILTPEFAGNPERQWQWLDSYDSLLLRYLHSEDDLGYEPGFVGWFDVEDLEVVKQRYMRDRRKVKVGLLFQRLRFDERLQADDREQFVDYLLGNVQPDVPSLFLELLKKAEGAFGKDAAYLKVWKAIGGMKVLSAEYLLEQLPDADPEIRAFLVDCNLSDAGSDGGAFFSAFDL